MKHLLAKVIPAERKIRKTRVEEKRQLSKCGVILKKKAVIIAQQSISTDVANYIMEIKRTSKIYHIPDSW